mmetsp:Transcript_17998/g.51095  ORF Transcript_17998/g.51095 Transcript_17998/m.51095 type:complete len:247 (-) Transcript_17998:758-1498(-)
MQAGAVSSRGRCSRVFPRDRIGRRTAEHFECMLMPWHDSGVLGTKRGNACASAAAAAIAAGSRTNHPQGSGLAAAMCRPRRRHLAASDGLAAKRRVPPNRGRTWHRALLRIRAVPPAARLCRSDRIRESPIASAPSHGGVAARSGTASAPQGSRTEGGAAGSRAGVVFTAGHLPPAEHTVDDADGEQLGRTGSPCCLRSALVANGRPLPGAFLSERGELRRTRHILQRCCSSCGGHHVSGRSFGVD